MSSFSSNDRRPASDLELEFGRTKKRQTLTSVFAIGGFTIVLMLLTVAHVFDWDATWLTENVMLLVFAAVLGAWTCHRWPVPVLVLAMIAVGVWCRADLARVSDWWFRLVCCAGRATAIGLLVVWTTAVRRSLERARHLAKVDSLTGLPNRQAVLQALEAELCRARRFGRAFSIAMLDCDGFKQINDQRGHLVGDQVLRQIGSALRKQTRVCDCIGRLGGDEFAMILSEANIDQVPVIIERLRSALRLELSREFPSLTYSIGVVTVQASNGDENPPLDWFGCLQRADQAMYTAKREGHDRTRFETLIRGIGRK